jgi:hypothetical protein
MLEGKGEKRTLVVGGGSDDYNTYLTLPSLFIKNPLRAPAITLPFHPPPLYDLKAFTFNPNHLK